MPEKRGGLLVTIEGIDGVGKTTHVGMLAEHLSSIGHEVVRLREPTDGPWGMKIKNLTKHGRTVTPEEEYQWFLKDRKEDVAANINPALMGGKIVILDRYYFSTMAYQGALGLDIERIREENERFAPRPDRVIILDVLPEIGLQRITEGRKDRLNYFETLEYQRKVRAIFLDMGNENNVSIVDASGGLEEVQGEIRRIVGDLIG